MRFVYKRFTINAIIYALIALTAGSVVYFRQTITHQNDLQQQQQHEDYLIDTYKGHITQLTQYIYSLKSRLKHIAEDNKRLSKVGTELVDKISGHSVDSEDKLAAIEGMHQELVALDGNIIEKYATYITHQNVCTDLKVACKKGSSKSKKCDEYQSALDVLDNMGSQIKYLNAKRDVLISAIQRNAAYVM